jgi:transposase
VSTMPEPQVLVTLGVDTHADTHVAAALDQLGRHLGTITVATTTRGFGELVEWASGSGVIDRVGVEGTGSWGAGLARWLRQEGFVVVDRPNRRTRRRHGKSDTIDAVAAARAVQSGEASGTPKAADGDVEAIRMLRVAHRSAVKARTQAANQLHALVVTAPDELRDQLRGLALRDLVAVAARLCPGDTPDTPASVTKYTLRSLARRYQQLDTEAEELKAQMGRVRRQGGSDAGRRARGEHLDRRGAARGGRRQSATSPFRRLVRTPVRRRAARRVFRQAGTPPTQPRRGPPGQLRAAHRRDRAHVTRREDQEIRRWTHQPGKTKREAIRCLKRYIARDIYRILVPIIAPEQTLDTT